MRFILTPELGRLLRWLRILGFDAVLERDKRELIMKSLREDRVILTRDTALSVFAGTRKIRIESDYRIAQ
jgi:uncharacterized protein with PIN domain